MLWYPYATKHNIYTVGHDKTEACASKYSNGVESLALTCIAGS